LTEVLCRDLYVFFETYRKLFTKAVDDKINQMLLFDLIVCLVLFHTTSKQTLPLTRCDRLMLDKLPLYRGSVTN